MRVATNTWVGGVASPIVMAGGCGERPARLDLVGWRHDQTPNPRCILTQFPSPSGRKLAMAPETG